jgi:hypothetical protein
VIHDKAPGIAKLLMPDVKGGAEAAARIARRRLDVIIPKWGLVKYPVKEFVALNQGDIQVTSDSSGTIVTVTLPSAKTL